MSSRDRESGKRQTPCVMYVRWVPSRTGPVVRARGPAVVHRPQPPWRGAAPRPATAPRPQTASRPTPTTPSPADIICSISLLHTRTCFLSYMLIVYKGVYRRIKVCMYSRRGWAESSWECGGRGRAWRGWWWHRTAAWRPWPGHKEPLRTLDGATKCD